jgi:hypothetical protein
VPLPGCTYAHHATIVALFITIDAEHTLALFGEVLGEIERGDRLADAALPIFLGVH